MKTYLFDFAKDDFEKLREYISDIDVGFVVNSVGVGRENLERYGDNPEADRYILRINGLGAAEVSNADQLRRICVWWKFSSFFSFYLLFFRRWKNQEADRSSSCRHRKDIVLFHCWQHILLLR